MSWSHSWHSSFLGSSGICRIKTGYSAAGVTVTGTTRVAHVFSRKKLVQTAHHIMLGDVRTEVLLPVMSLTETGLKMTTYPILVVSQVDNKNQHIDATSTEVDRARLRNGRTNKILLLDNQTLGMEFEMLIPDDQISNNL